ncbi:hypothetical protein Clacol_000144 [Clathrus columnatus]|uniref:Uncharacterized protein n=1 Tax=Clathrus columnatus TaxID=1419009 RepID=A0AAV4ZWB7_9AGAM|nr:hypothetical protein Clacol_000144 [Clathrus columnatus]
MEPECKNVRQADVIIEHPDEEELSFGQPSHPMARRIIIPSPPFPSVIYRLLLHRSRILDRLCIQLCIRYEYNSNPGVIQEGEAVYDMDEDTFAHEIEIDLADTDDNNEADGELKPVPIEGNIPAGTE